MRDSATIELYYNTLIKGLSRFFEKAGKRRAVLGLSGGIDSALVAAIAAKALGRENLHAILMPSPFSTLHSVTDAVELAETLGIEHSIVTIESIYHRYMRELDELMGGEIKGITSENIQARIRGTILMAYSNNSGALLLNTSNKSELSIGYGTLYGDLCGALMVIADLYKLEVYEMASYINSIEPTISASTLTKPPSAELSDNQKDSDSLPEYSVLDPILHGLIEEKRSAQEVIESGADPEVTQRVVQLMNNSAFKLLQVPPLLQLRENHVVPKNKLFKCL